MIRYRNGDRDLRELERAYLADPSDLVAYEALLAARLRAGVPVDDPRMPPQSVEAYALLIEARVRSGVTTRPRVVMAARLGHAGAQAAAPEWERLGGAELRTAIGALGRREIVAFACDCAERVLPLFERAMPEDVRPRRAIEAARAWVVSPSEKAASVAAVAANHAAVAANAAGDDADVAGYAACASFAADTAAASSTFTAAEAADDASDDNDAVRLAQYLLGEVPLPPIKKTARKKTRSN